MLSLKEIRIYFNSYELMVNRWAGKTRGGLESELWGQIAPFFPQQKNAALWPGAKIIWESLMRRAEQQLTRVRVAIIRCGSHPPPNTPKMLPLASSSRFSQYRDKQTSRISRVSLCAGFMRVCARSGRTIPRGQFTVRNLLKNPDGSDRNDVLGRVLKCLKRLTFLKMSSGRNVDFDF